MPPPWATNPAPKTESAREALKTFFCDLCQKGYSRVNEFEAHEGSYDHQHKKRLKEMRALSRDPTAASRAREREEKDSGVFAAKNTTLSGSTGSGSGGGGFKKGGFKKAGGFTRIGGPEPSSAPAQNQDDAMEVDPLPGKGKGVDLGDDDDDDHDGRGEVGDGEGEGAGDDDDWDRWGSYDPLRPTGCAEAGCTWSGLG